MHHRSIRLPRRRAVLALSLLLPGWGRVRAAPTAPGQPVPWPTVRLLDGRSVAAGDLRGRAAVVVLFSTDCAYCRRHNRHVDRLMRSSGDLPLTVIGAALDRDRAAVDAYLAREAYAFPVTMDSAPLREVLTARRVMPLTCVIDRQGVLREVIPGEMAEDDVLGLAKWART
jgi:peroxiredoxin